MAEEWVMVRVRRATHDALTALGRRLRAAHDTGQMEPWWPGEDVSHDAIINKLLARAERHRQRRRR